MHPHEGQSDPQGALTPDADLTGAAPERQRPFEPAGSGARVWLRNAFELVRSVALVLVLFFLVRSFVVEAFKIPTSSMEGTLLAGDFLLVNKAVYGAEIPGTGFSIPAFAEPDRGDIVVFHPPHDPAKHYVKRLLGLPGDTLQMREKLLLVNGSPVEEPYVRHQDPTGDAVHPGMVWQMPFVQEHAVPSRYRPSRDNWGPLVVPEDHFFVLGDNRDNSEDSRYWGFISRESIKGRPWRVYYSADQDHSGVLSWFRDVRWDRIGGLIE
ncbi:MAG: signal peptidase I [Gemmatimonadota bacterium]